MAGSEERKSLVYLSYGDGPHVLEIMFSVTSAKRFLELSGSAVDIVIFTDTPKKFAFLGVETHLLDEYALTNWLGGQDYIHRRKLLCVKTAMETRGGSLAFIDSDTYFTRSPELLFDRVQPGHVCLHILEGRLSDKEGRPTEPLSRAISLNSFYDLAGTKLTISTTEQMWNSGVIGIHASDAALIDEAINFTDALWLKVKSVMTIEQFAVGFFLSNRLVVREAADIVVHYWPTPVRKSFREQLKKLFNPPPHTDGQASTLYRYRPKPSLRARFRNIIKTAVIRLRLPISVFRSSYG